MDLRHLHFISLENDERTPVLLLTLRALFASIIVVVAFSYQSALFLSRFPADHLPWFYAFAAAVTVGFSIPYTRIIARFGENRGDRLVCLLFITGLVPGWFLDLAGNPPAAVFIYSTWVKMVGLFINIFLWHHATQTFISRRAKVILPFIAAGFSLGSAFGGIIVQGLAATWGNQALLALLMVLVGALLFVPIPPMQEVPKGRKGSGGSLWKRGFTTLRENRLALWLTVFVLLAIPVFLGMDFMLKKSLQERWTRDAIAGFMGKYYFYTNLTVFFLQTLLMGKLMRRVGVPRMTWFMPLFLLAALPVIIFAPLFLPIAIIAITSATLKSTVYINARNQLITPLSPLEKESTSMMLRTVVTPIGTIVASFALIPVAGAGLPVIAAVNTGICLVFLYSAHKAASAYMHELQTALRKRTLTPELSHNLAIAPDGRVVAHLRQRLLSDEPDEAIFAATLLSEYNELRLADLHALWHRKEEDTFSLCASKAVELARFTPAADQEAFFTRILENPFSARMAIRVLEAAAHLPPQLRTVLGQQTQLHSTGPVQTATACILLEVSAQSLQKKEFTDLLDLLLAGSAHEKRLALRLAGRLDPAQGEGVLSACLSCGEPEVVKDAIGRVGAQRQKNLYNACYTLSFRPEYRKAALDTFRTAGVELAMSSRAFAEGCPAGLRKEWIRILCTGTDPVALDRIMELLRDADAWTCSVVLDQLARPGSLQLPPAFLERTAWRIGRACIAASRAQKLSDTFTAMELEAQKRFWTRALFQCVRLMEPTHAGELLEIEKSVFSRDLRQQNAGLELWETWFQSRGKNAFALLLEPPEVPHADWELEPVQDSPAGLLEVCCEPRLASLMTERTGRRSAAQAEDDLLAPVLFLRQSDFFRYLPTEVLLEMTRLGETVHLPAGRILFEEKSPGDALYCVFRGRLSVRIQKTQVNELRQGAVFGEIALLDSGPRSATIAAIEDSTLLKISRETFSEVLQEHPFVVKQVAMTLAARIRDLVVLIERRASGPIRSLGEELA